MNRQALDIKYSHAFHAEKILKRNDREIGQVFMIDCVELAFVQQIHQVGNFENCHTFRLEQYVEPREKIPEMSNVGENIVANHHGSAAMAGSKCSSASFTEEIVHRLQSLAIGDCCDVGSRLNSQTPDFIPGEC